MRILAKGIAAAALLLSFVYAAPQAEAGNYGKITQGSNSTTNTSSASITQSTTSSGTNNATVTHTGEGSYSISIDQNGFTTNKSGSGYKKVRRRR